MEMERTTNQRAATTNQRAKEQAEKFVFENSGIFKANTYYWIEVITNQLLAFHLEEIKAAQITEGEAKITQEQIDKELAKYL
jgi:hypothetical protein